MALFGENVDGQSERVRVLFNMAVQWVCASNCVYRGQRSQLLLVLCVPYMQIPLPTRSTL